MELEIKPLIDGFGKESERLYEKIANTPYVNPTDVFHIYNAMFGIDALTDDEFKAQAEPFFFKASLTENEINTLVDLQIRNGVNIKFGNLTQTRAELKEELRKRIKAMQI